MPKVSRSGIDNAGGGIISSVGQNFVKIDSALAIVEGDPVANHGSTPHDSAIMGTGSTFVKIGGKKIIFSGKLASCGDAATGSGHVFVNV